MSSVIKIALCAVMYQVHSIRPLIHDEKASAQGCDALPIHYQILIQRCITWLDRECMLKLFQRQSSECIAHPCHGFECDTSMVWLLILNSLHSIIIGTLEGGGESPEFVPNMFDRETSCAGQRLSVKAGKQEPMI